MNNFALNYGAGLGPLWPLMILLLVWSMFWKGLALWHSSRRAQPWWFVIFMIVNTAGILEIIYLFLVAKLKFSKLFSKG
jgi:methionyl-tRNA synthetase